MLLLPGAERERRALLLGAALILGALLSWWPLPPLERLADRALGLGTDPLASASFWIARQVGPEPPAPGALPAPPPGWLDALERRAALPAPVNGLAWVEVPVIGISRHGSELRLGAGRALGLAAGMVAACGGEYLGRIAAVEDHSATLLHFAAVDERTGVRLRDANGVERDAILLGRGVRPALLAPIEDGAIPAGASPVTFRGRRSDPPALAAAGLRLGVAASDGDPRRGERAWSVATRLPALAEGRVFVAAGALPAEPIEPPAPAQAVARETLRWDAVLGARFSAFTLDGALPAPPAVVQRAGRALGPVVRMRGRLGWVRMDPVEAWIRAGAAQAAPAAAPLRGWHTRGVGGVPRGLWLGTAGEPLPRHGEAQFLVAPFPREL